MYVCLACMYVYTPSMCLVPTESEGGIEFPRTVIKNGCKVLGTKPWSSAKAASAFNYETIFLIPGLISFILLLFHPQ